MNISKENRIIDITRRKGKVQARRFGACARLFLFLAILSGSFTGFSKKAQATFCVPVPCVACIAYDPAIAVVIHEAFQELIFSPLIEMNIEDHLNSVENWIVEDFFVDFWVKGLAEMTEYLGVAAMHQIEIVGTFFDAKNNLETQRVFFELQAEAHRDYHPSDDFCWFGTGVRSLAASDSRAKFTKEVLSSRSISRQLGYPGSGSAGGSANDKHVRWHQFVINYCDPKDNNWSEAGSGLDLACDRDGVGGSAATGAIDLNRVNKDIDYTRLIDEPRTLDINFGNTTLSPTGEEADVLAMSANLYANNVLTRSLSRKSLANVSAQRLYMDLRSVVAKRSVAENSFNSIVGMKAAGAVTGAAAPNTGEYLAAIIKDLMPVGTPNSEIVAMLGENPSYYAQLEILGKKIYQNPDFYANLYDGPANVARKSVAMKGIELMLDRALFESELRQEMILSVLLSSKLNAKYRTLNRDLTQRGD